MVFLEKYFIMSHCCEHTKINGKNFNFILTLKKINFYNTFFNESDFFLQELQGDYQVELTFNMEEKLAGKPYTLEVTNDHGTTQYTFQLKLGEAPPPSKCSYHILFEMHNI